MGRQIRNFDFDEQVAKKLKELRTSKKILQKEVAHKMGMAVMSIQNHESGNFPHNLYVTMKYCKIYGLTITQFLEGIDI
jgi:transcriptional regulator with XRE-family HTH domain